MTDDHTSDDRTLGIIDTRGRAAATGVRAAVADRPVPLFDPDVVRIPVDGDRGPRSRRPIVIAATVLVLLGAAVAVVALGADDDEPPTAVVAGDPQRLVLPTEVQGLTLSTTFDRSLPDDAVDGVLGPTGPIAFYGPDAPALAVYARVEPGGVTSGPDPAAMATFDVDGRRAWRGEGTGPGDDLFVVVGEALVTVVAIGAEEDALLAAAGAVVVDGDRATVPAATLPDGWSHLGDVRSEELGPGVAVVRDPGAPPVGWAATSYGDGGQVTVAVSTGGTVDDRVPALVTDRVDEVEVRGHEAVVARLAADVLDGPETVMLTWEERPGEVVQLLGVEGIDAAVLLQLADELEVVAPDDLAGLRQEIFETRLAQPGTVVVGRGRFDDGIAWALVETTDDDYLELAILPPPRRTWGLGWGTSGGSDEASAASPFNGSSVQADGGDGWVAFGGLDPEVTDVEVRLDGSDQPVEVTFVMGGGHRGWVAHLPGRRPGQVPAGEAIAHGLDGGELGRLDLGQPAG